MAVEFSDLIKKKEPLITWNQQLNKHARQPMKWVLIYLLNDILSKHPFYIIQLFFLLDIFNIQPPIYTCRKLHALVSIFRMIDH